MLDPDVLVLDEPSSNLDFASIGLLRKIVAKWKAEGRTVLISEHRLHWLEGIADRIIVMRSGSVEREIDSTQFYASTAAEARALGLRAPTFAAIAAEQCCARCEKKRVCRNTGYELSLPAVKPRHQRFSHCFQARRCHCHYRKQWCWKVYLRTLHLRSCERL